MVSQLKNVRNLMSPLGEIRYGPPLSKCLDYLIKECVRRIEIYIIVVENHILYYITIFFVQFRHPVASPTAYSVFGFTAFLIFIEAVVLYAHNWWTYGAFLLIYVIMTVYLAFDTYYIGVDRVDSKVAVFLAKVFCKKLRAKPKVAGIQSGFKQEI